MKMVSRAATLTILAIALCLAHRNAELEEGFKRREEEDKPESYLALIGVSFFDRRSCMIGATLAHRR